MMKRCFTWNIAVLWSLAVFLGGVGALCAEPAIEYNAHGKETLTVGASAVGFTAGNLLPRASALVGGTRNVTFSVEDASIRWWIDGSSPTASVGHLASTGTYVSINGYDNIRNFRAIRTGGTNATLQISYEH